MFNKKTLRTLAVVSITTASMIGFGASAQAQQTQNAPQTTSATAPVSQQATNTSVPQNSTVNNQVTSTQTATPSPSATNTPSAVDKTTAIGPAEPVMVNPNASGAANSNQMLKGVQLSPLDNELLNQINTYRAQYGLPAVTINTANSTRAASWSQQMNTDQKGPYHKNGWYNELQAGWYAVGEDTAMNYTRDSDVATAAAILQTWKDSDAHNRIVLSNQFNSIGVGTALGNNKQVWATIDLAGYPSSSGATPSITKQPADVTINTGQTANLTSTVAGATRYQWQEWYSNPYAGGAWQWFPKINAYSNNLSISGLPAGTYKYLLTAMNNNGITTSREVTVNVSSYNQWQKYAWSDSLYKVPQGQNGVPVSYDEWKNAGFPTPQTVGYIPGTKVYQTKPGAMWAYPPNNSPFKLNLDQWKAMGFRQDGTLPYQTYNLPSSGALFAVSTLPNNSYDIEKLNFDKWKSMGYPASKSTPRFPGVYFVQFKQSAAIVAKISDVMYGFGSWQEYLNAGSPPVQQSNEGIVKNSWSDGIFYVPNWSDFTTGRPFTTFQQWKETNFIKATVVNRVPGDSFYKYKNFDAIYYHGIGPDRGISFDEWKTAGFPKPTIK